MTTTTFDVLSEKINVGERLAPADITSVSETSDILTLGMLADSLRRRLHDTRVTYLRVANCPFDKSFSEAVPPAAREVRITGEPDSLHIAVAAVESAKAVAGERAVSGFSWLEIERLADAEGTSTEDALTTLHSAGLEALADVPMDRITDMQRALDTLCHAGYQRVRLNIESASGTGRMALLLRAADLQDQFRCIQAINPLPAKLSPLRPTTGYDDVKVVAVARLAAPNIQTIQVDWTRYGPKLAQVALTFGADDLDNVSAADDVSQGHRRAPLAELQRNIEAAGFHPVERDGRFAVAR